MKRISGRQLVNPLAKQIGHFSSYWGFKEVHGNIWTHIYLSKSPLSAKDLIDRLNISKALISLTLKDLLHFHLVFQTEESLGRRNKYYVANPDLIPAIQKILLTRELLLIEGAHKEYKILRERNQNASEEVDTDRLKKLGVLIESGQATLQDFFNNSKFGK